jgi:hypothetical protein
MHSALSVLALLLAAGETQDPKPTSVEVPALEVSVDFRCASPTTQSLMLTPKAQGQVKVPESCPDAGADWRVTVHCAEDTCSGIIRTPLGAIARVEGSRKKLQVKPLAKPHPPTLDLLALKITGQYSLTMPSAEDHQRPLQLLLQHPAVTGVYTLSPSERLPVVFELWGKRLVLNSEAQWTDDEHVRLKLRGSHDALVFDATLVLKEQRELDCKQLDGFCQGSLKLWVREYQALPIQP